MAAVTICSDFGAQENKVCHVFHCFPIYLPWSDVTGWASLIAQLVKNLPEMQKTPVRFLGWEDPLETGKATHSSILAWRIPWAILSMESDRTERLYLSLSALRSRTSHLPQSEHSHLWNGTVNSPYLRKQVWWLREVVILVGYMQGGRNLGKDWGDPRNP